MIKDVKKLTEDCIHWIDNWLSENGNETTKVILNISGGKDSTVVGALLKEAIGSDRIVGLMLPNGEQKDISDSIRVCNEVLNINNYTINIGNTYDSLTNELRVVSSNNGLEYPTQMYKTNTPARLRMVTAYSVGALLGNCRVVNTCNLSEDKLGYSTFYGDSAGDFAPIRFLTTEEVIAIGDYLGVPYELTHKTPSDGMCGKSDEDNLGFTYKEVNELIRENIRGSNYDKIISKYKTNKFKIDIINLPGFDPKLPDYLI